jgi:voltage-dependent potassium channel beta subunit
VLYRRLGSSGLKVSAISLGAWATIGETLDLRESTRLLDEAYGLGVNFFDNAETYGDGVAEATMGRALAALGWSRETFLVSSKVYWGTGSDRPTAKGLSRKHVFEACEGALRRLGIDYLDLYLCHRPDPETPIEETVRAMSDLISHQGKVLYWGTSEWSAQAITEAHRVARELGLVAPITEQAQYNLLTRSRVEREYAELYSDPGLGLTIWSPLAYGLLTGRYNEGLDVDGRLARAGYEWLRDGVLGESPRRLTAAVRAFCLLAREHGVAPAQLSMAWVLRNDNVSTAITGASSIAQLRETVAAVDLPDLLTRALCDELDRLFTGDLVL